MSFVAHQHRLALRAPFAGPGANAAITLNPILPSLEGCYLLNNRGFLALRSPRSLTPNVGTTVNLGISKIGVAGQFNPVTQTSVIAWPINQITYPLTIECLFITGPTVANTSIFQVNDNFSPPSGTYDKAILFDGAGHLTAYVYDGAQKTATDTTTTYLANTIYHVTMVVDGVNLYLYTNGVLVAQTPATGSYGAFGTPFLCVGGGYSNSAGGNIIPVASILFVNYGRTAWPASVISSRALDPFGIFVPAFAPLRWHFLASSWQPRAVWWRP